MKQINETYKEFLDAKKRNKPIIKPTVVRTALVGGNYSYQGTGVETSTAPVGDASGGAV